MRYGFGLSVPVYGLPVVIGDLPVVVLAVLAIASRLDVLAAVLTAYCQNTSLTA